MPEAGTNATSIHIAETGANARYTHLQGTNELTKKLIIKQPTREQIANKQLTHLQHALLQLAVSYLTAAQRYAAFIKSGY